MTRSTKTLSITTLNITTLSIDGFNLRALYAECRYAECRYAECRYAECLGAAKKRKKGSSHCRAILNVISSSIEIGDNARVFVIVKKVGGREKTMCVVYTLLHDI